VYFYPKKYIQARTFDPEILDLSSIFTRKLVFSCSLSLLASVLRHNIKVQNFFPFFTSLAKNARPGDEIEERMGK
jgi:hypothetical protein